MKRPTLVLSIIAGFLVFLGVLVLYLPASWFASALPAQVRCAELGGSVWQGECLGLAVQDAKLGDVTWNLAIGSALSGRAVGDVALTGDTQRLNADLDMGRDGSGQLSNVNGFLKMDPAILPQLPRNQRGTVTVRLSHVELSAGAEPRVLEGTIELTDLRQVGPRPMALGSYVLKFDRAASTNGQIVGQLEDRGGPFIVSGTLSLFAPRSYIVQGFITGRTAEAERMVREITLGAPPDTSGRSAFSFEGSY